MARGALIWGEIVYRNVVRGVLCLGVLCLGLKSLSATAQSPSRELKMLETFAGKSVQSPSIFCQLNAGVRAPASGEQKIAIRYKLDDAFQRIVFQIQNQKITQATLELLENDPQAPAFEFIRWKTFVPEVGRFQIDLEGQQQFSNMILKGQKPQYMKALEKLGPAVLQYCQRP